MITLDDLKSNRDTQITVACIVFFLIAFPGYFAMKGGDASGSGAMGGVADYNVNGELTYVQITDGIEYIADGDTLMIDDLHTDAVDGAEDMNIVGVRVMMSYGEDEDGQNVERNEERSRCKAILRPDIKHDALEVLSRRNLEQEHHCIEDVSKVFQVVDLVTLLQVPLLLTGTLDLDLDNKVREVAGRQACKFFQISNCFSFNR